MYHFSLTVCFAFISKYQEGGIKKLEDLEQLEHFFVRMTGIIFMIC